MTAAHDYLEAAERAEEEMARQIRWLDDNGRILHGILCATLAIAHSVVPPEQPADDTAAPCADDTAAPCAGFPHVYGPACRHPECDGWNMCKHLGWEGARQTGVTIPHDNYHRCVDGADRPYCRDSCTACSGFAVVGCAACATAAATAPPTT